MTNKKQEILPPEGGWLEHTWYVVNVSFRAGNPIHRSLFFSGFLNGGKPADKIPGGYSGFVPLNGPDDSEPTPTLRDVKYVKALWPLCNDKGIRSAEESAKGEG